MSTLTRIATALQASLEGLEGQDADESQITRAENRLNGLREAIELLGESVSAALDLAKHGPSNGLLRPLQTVSVPEDPTQPLAWLQSDDAVNLRDSVRSRANEIRAAVKEEWQLRLGSLSSPPADRSGLHALEGIAKGAPAIRAAVADLRDASEDHAELARVEIPEIGDAEQLASVEQRLNHAWATITAAGVEPERLELLRSLGSVSGHLLQDLTSEQLDWLKTSGAAADFVIKRQAVGLAPRSRGSHA